MSFETKTLPSGIVIENRPVKGEKYFWYIKNTNLLHNEGAPAVEHTIGDKFWIQHNKFHRLDGPTCEYADKTKRYYIDDLAYEEEEYWKHSKVKEYLYLKEHPELKAFT